MEDDQQNSLISLSPAHNYQMYKCELKWDRLSLTHKLVFLKYLGVNAEFFEEPEIHEEFIHLMCNELNEITFTESRIEWIRLLNYWINSVELREHQKEAGFKVQFDELDKKLQRIIGDGKQSKMISSTQLTCILNYLEDSTNVTQVWTSIRENLHRICDERKSEGEWEQIFLSFCTNLLAKQDLCNELLKKNTLKRNSKCLQFSKIDKRLLNYIQKNKIPNISDDNRTDDDDDDDDDGGIEEEVDETEKEELTYLTRCRVCLIDEKNMKYIFDNNVDSVENDEDDEYSENVHRISIGEKFNKCINDSTIVDKNDGYPQFICSNCLILLDNAYSFKMLYEKSYKTLLQLTELNTLDDIKIIDNVSTFPKVESELQQEEEEEEEEEQEETMESEVENVCDSENAGNETELEHCDQESRHITHEEYTICLNDYEVYNSEAELNDNIIITESQPINPEYLDEDNDYDDENNIKEINLKTDKLQKEKMYMVANLQCETCGIISKNETSLKIHKKSHSNRKPHQCNRCGKEFKTSVSLKVHMRSHTGERPYVCETCGKAFKTCSAVTNHRAIHANVKEFKCPHCSYCASTKANLKIHDRTHSGIQPYRCVFCPLKFSTASNMHKHTRNIHQKMKTHKCDQCERSFFSRESARKHTVIHTGLKPYVCTECPTTYGWYNGLQKHMKIQHPGVKMPTEKSYFINVKIIDET